MITTADITTGCGRYIETEYIKKPNKRPRTSKYNWPYQPIPSKKIWATWEKAITSVLCKDTTYQIHTKLGAWIQKSHQNFEYFVNTKESKLYKKVKDTWKKYTPFNTSRRWAHTFDNDPTPTNEPEYIVPTTIEHTSTLLICAHIPPPENTTPTPQHTNNSHPMFNEATEFVQKMMIQVNTPTQWTHLINAFQSGTAVCVTDGSYDPFTDTAAVCWLIEGKNDIGRCKGFDRVYGDKRFMDPYRSELHGIYCILLFVKYFCKYFDIKNGTIKIVCDCKGALHSALKWDERATTTCKHYDLIWSIYELRKEITVQIIPEHVYGHQDDLGKNLTRLEQLNCETDHGAKRYLQYCQDNNIKAQGEPYGSQWKLSINNILINQQIDTQIISAIHGKRLRKFLIEKGRIASETFDLINWNAIRKANKKLTTHERTWITKHVSRFAATGRNMLRRKEWTNSKCPRCGQHDEDTNHVIICQDKEAEYCFEKAVITFKEKLIKMETAPIITATIIYTLFGGQESFFSDMIKTDDNYENDDIQRTTAAAAIEQDMIGWFNFIEGKMSSKWEIAQEQYYRIQNSRNRKGSNWASTVVSCLNNIIRTQWFH